ncbi:MAG: AbrB/MazE/SpoVT family DNA-binding domain-containing protein [Micropepsaceae bacterium]
MGYPAKLRKVGGSVMVSIPPAVLDELRLKPNANVEFSVKGGRMVIDHKVKSRRPSYTLEDLLAQCKPGRLTKEDKEWLSSPPVGRELI